MARTWYGLHCLLLVYTKQEKQLSAVKFEVAAEQSRTYIPAVLL